MRVREKPQSIRCGALTSAAVITLTLISVSGQTARADTVPAEDRARQSSVISNGERQAKPDGVPDEEKPSIPPKHTDNADNNEIDNNDSHDANDRQVVDGDEDTTPEPSSQSTLEDSGDQREIKDGNHGDEHSGSLSVPNDSGSGDTTVTIAKRVRPESVAVGEKPVPTARIDTETIDQWMPNKRLQQAVLRNLNELNSGRQWKKVADISKDDMLLLTSFDNDNSYIDGKTAYSLKGLEYATNMTELTLCTGINNNIDGIHDRNYYQGDVRDISPLANLTKLTSLNIQYNKISDISVLSNLTKLTDFAASMNDIGDFRPLRNLPNLTSFSGGNQFINLKPIYINRKTRTAHLANNCYLPNGNKVTLVSTPIIKAPIWINNKNQIHWRYYILGTTSRVDQDENGGLSFTNIEDQHSGNFLNEHPDLFPNIVYQKDLFFLTGVSGSSDASLDFIVVQPYILADKAAAVTVHYQDEAGKVLAQDQVLDDGYIGEAYATRPLKIKGYTFKEVKDHNATGQYTATPQTVIYIYAAAMAADDNHSTGNGSNNGSDTHVSGPAPVTPPIVPITPAPLTPTLAQPVAPTPTQLLSSTPAMLDEATAVADSAGVTIQGISVNLSERPRLSVQRVVFVRERVSAKPEAKPTPATLPQTNERHSQLKVWGIIGLALSSLGATIFGRHRP